MNNSITHSRPAVLSASSAGATATHPKFVGGAIGAGNTTDADLVNLALNGVATPPPELDLQLQNSASLRQRLRDLKMGLLLGSSPELDRFFAQASVVPDPVPDHSRPARVLPTSLDATLGQTKQCGRELHVVSMSSPIGSRIVKIRDDQLARTISDATEDIDQGLEDADLVAPLPALVRHRELQRAAGSRLTNES
jgi:hypothetical protein